MCECVLTHVHAHAGVSPEELLQRLTAVRGIGPWTVDMVRGVEREGGEGAVYMCALRRAWAAE